MNEYRQGEHICVFYNTPQEQRTMAAEYLADGLRRGERAYYVTESTEALSAFHGALRRTGVDVERALKTRALVEATHVEAHLVDGVFDSERMLRSLNDGVEAALNDGFVGLRTCGDMSWLLLDPPGADQAVEYEALLNQFFQAARACGMCQYDLARLPATLLDHGLATHSTAVIDGRHKPNQFYRAPAIAIARAAQPDDLQWKLRELRGR